MYNLYGARYNNSDVFLHHQGAMHMKVFAGKAAVTQELAEIKCNMCGKEIQKNAFGCFDDYMEVTKVWGYHSEMDGETHGFDICGGCYQEWVKKFAIPVKEG